MGCPPYSRKSCLSNRPAAGSSLLGEAKLRVPYVGRAAGEKQKYWLCWARRRRAAKVLQCGCVGRAAGEKQNRVCWAREAKLSLSFGHSGRAAQPTPLGFVDPSLAFGSIATRAYNLWPLTRLRLDRHITFGPSLAFGSIAI